MSITTNLPNRVRNTQLPYSQGLMPLFEAVQNSIHSIDERRQENPSGKIRVVVKRNPQSSLIPQDTSPKRGPDSLPEIIGFEVTDDGLGFNNRNFESFETLDTDLKASIGGRGIGRLLWLKAFNSASVNSIYIDDDGTRKRRQFAFTAKQGVVAGDPVTVSDDEPIKTTVALNDFDERYRNVSRKTGDAIANLLFEHCLWYFVRDGGAPSITIQDGESVILLDDVYQEHMHSSAEAESLTLKDIKFDLLHIKLRAAHAQSHRIGWCAANRLVKEDAIASKIPGLFGKLGEDDSRFIYMCYVSSPYLDERVRPERTDFVLEQSPSNNTLFSETEFTLEELSKEILVHIGAYLEPYLIVKREAGLKRLNQFVAEVQPRYRAILEYVPEMEKFVDPDITDKDLDVLLHKYRSEKERELISEGHKIMRPSADENLDQYENRVKDYLKLADDIKKSDLAEYVSHRKVILDLLGLAIEQQDGGKYSKEEIVHDLIMPLRKTSNSIEFERNNLWLINERLAFHDFLASDTTLNAIPITGSSDTKKPDVVALNVYDQPLLLSEGTELPLASIVVVELKRPMRNDAKAGEEHDPIEQALGYLDRIRKGSVLTPAGRPIPNSPDIPGFCYVVCDLTSSVKRRCELAGLTVTSDYLGYFGFNPNYKAYIEVISFDQLLKGGRERNRAFFDRLGLPNN